MTETHKTTVAALVELIKEWSAKDSHGQDWQPITAVMALIPDQMAKAHLATLPELTIKDANDPLSVARLFLARDAIKASEDSGMCEVRGEKGKEEVLWLLPAAATATKAEPPTSTKSNKSDMNASQATTQRNTQSVGENVPVSTTHAPAAKAVSTSTMVTRGKTHAVSAPANNDSPTDRDQDNGCNQPQEAIEKTISITEIRADPALQLRVKQDPTVVKEYAERMEHRKFPPLLVVFDGTVYWLVDGFYRLAALEMRKADTVTVLVINGTRDYALWLAVAANKGHGLRRTQKDIARAVEAALTHPSAKDLSDNEIAEHVGVTGRTVGNYRKRLQNFCSQPEQRTGRDGRTINVSNIGKGKRGTGRQQDPTSTDSATAEVPAPNSPNDNRTELPAVGTAGHTTVADAPDDDTTEVKIETGAQSQTPCGNVPEQGGGTKDNDIQDTKSEVGTDKKQEADEAEGFRRYRELLPELEATLERDKGGFAALALKLKPKDRDLLMKQQDNVTDRMKKLSKARDAA